MMQNLALSATSWNLQQSEAYCETLARTHYENFTVGSFFIPRRLRKHMYNVYAFCRWSDDLGDETRDRVRAYRLLDDWEKELDACYAGHATHPIFIALQQTIREFDLPKELFWRLIQAFKQDQVKPRYVSFENVLAYCENSANPVGRLVLHLFGYKDEERAKLSDLTCTALQLANFWQDAARDMKIGRLYVPLEDLTEYNVTENDFSQPSASPNFKKLMAFQVNRTWEFFQKGMPLVDMVKGALKIDLEAFTQGGLAVLDGIRKIDYDVLAQRPVVSRTAKVGILFRAMTKYLFG